MAHTRARKWEKSWRERAHWRSRQGCPFWSQSAGLCLTVRGSGGVPHSLAAVAAPTHSPSSASYTPFHYAVKGHSNIRFPMDPARLSSHGIWNLTGRIFHRVVESHTLWTIHTNPTVQSWKQGWRKNALAQWCSDFHETESLLAV